MRKEIIKHSHFLKHPFIPNGPVSLALADRRISTTMENELISLGVSIVKTAPSEKLYEAISCHPDVLCTHLGNGLIIADPSIQPKLGDKLEPFGFEVVCGKSTPSSAYPQSVPYNVAVAGKFFIHNMKYTDPTLLRHLKENYTPLNVKQGYAKCSIAVVSEGAVITEDPGIFKAVRRAGIDAILIDRGDIVLEGMEYGFIGGASGLVDRNKLAFFGDLASHRNSADIKTFLRNHNVEAVSLSTGPLMDLGSLIPLMTRKDRLY